MIPTRGGGRWSSDTIAVALLAATFVAVSFLLGQAVVTVRSHERVVASTLDDFAAYAAERVAADLDAAFSAIFLDEITVSRAGHYAWVTGREAPAPSAPGRRRFDEAAIPAHFSIDGDSVVWRGAAMDRGVDGWLLSEVGAHAAEIYPEPAPYALLRPGGPDGDRAVAYRKEEAYEGLAIFGFLIRFSEFGSVYGRVIERASLLPPSMVGAVEPERLMTVRLVIPQTGELLLEALGPDTRHPVRGQAMAGKAGRLRVEVEMDADMARALIPGAARVTSVPLFASLALLTLVLLGVSVVQLRRGWRLAQLRETFVANVSHDLRTPLAQIRMFSETLLLARLEDGDERRRALEIIRRQAGELSDLVDNIVHASASGRAPLRPTPTDLGRLLEEVVEALTPAAVAREVVLVPRATGAASAEVDPAALRRILVNLVDNAIKYGPVGQVVTVTVDGAAEAVQVVVEDGGPGVPRRDRTRVWKRFTRLPGRDETVTGTGLGLAVVRDLAERHGGTVGLEDAAGGGARVSVRLASGASA